MQFMLKIEESGGKELRWKTTKSKDMLFIVIVFKGY